MIELERWLQGDATCKGMVPTREAQGEGATLCLWLAVDKALALGKETSPHYDSIAAVIDRLFPELACSCGSEFRGKGFPMPLIHFNNHPLVTRDMVEKVLHTWEMER